MKAEETKPRLPALTSVRFLAAFWVALFHMQSMKSYSLPEWSQKFASIGYGGVSFFFVLSGFILVYTYSDRSVSKRDFWQARFARIYPAFAFALLITMPGFFWVCLKMDAAKTVPDWGWAANHFSLSVVSVLTLMQAWIPQVALAWNMPAWSLSVEAFFYACFPFLLPVFKRLSGKQLLAIIPLGWLLALAVAGGPYWMQWERVQGAGPMTVDAWVNFVKFHPLIRLPEFLMGMACGVLFLRNGKNRSYAWPMILAGIAGVAVVTLLSPRIPYLVLHTAIMAPAFAAMIYGIALRPAGLGVLENRILELFGDASYTFYLLHSLVIGAFFGMGLGPNKVRNQSGLGFVLWFVIAVFVAMLIYKLIEEPLRRKLRPKPKTQTDALPIEAKATA